MTVLPYTGYLALQPPGKGFADWQGIIVQALEGGMKGAKAWLSALHGCCGLCPEGQTCDSTPVTRI